jgi:hypothetical protein
MGLTSPLINGFYYAMADVELQANGLLFAGVAAIDYDDNLARAKVYGTASTPLGLTKGKYEANGSIEFYIGAAQILQLSLVAWRQVPLVITISYVPSGLAPLVPIFDSIPGCYIGKATQANKIGDDALTRKFELHIPGQILWNGVQSFFETSTIGAVA